MKFSATCLLLITLLVTACKKDDGQDMETLKTSPSESFLPMEIGNYWRNNAENFTEIRDTMRINNKLYYQFYSLVGGDGIAISYMRIDEQNQLWESYPSAPVKEYLSAKFSANVGDTFFTLNDQTVNDLNVKMINKTDNERTFEYDRVYHPNLKGHPYSRTYIKGRGFSGTWKEVRISGVVF
jgi:hypothetical protein